MGWFQRLFGNKSPIQSSSTGNGGSHLPLTKYYAFNETGNVMVSTTNEGSYTMNETLKKMFLDMSIFFAAMTKAIASSKVDSKTVSDIYDFDAITKILDSSEFFVKTKEENIEITSTEVGHKMSKELTEKLLGREFNETKLNFSKGLLHSLADSKKNFNEAGSIFFICESILGLPMVSAVVIRLESHLGKGTWLKQPSKEEDEDFKPERDIKEILEIEEHNGTNKIQRKWEFEKDTYIFISPRSISGENFPAPGDDQAYDQLVASLKTYLDADKK